MITEKIHSAENVVAEDNILARTKKLAHLPLLLLFGCVDGK